MAKKKAIKQSEARIIIYLNTSDKPLHFVRKISSKLDMDYGYTIKILMSMLEKGWISKDKSAAYPSRSYYHLTEAGKLKLVDATNVTAEAVEETE